MKPLFIPFKTPGGNYVYDGNRNAIIETNEYDYQELLECFRNNYKSNEVLKKYQEKGFLLCGNIKKIVHPQSDLLDFYLDSCVEKITLQLTQACNLRCEYCTYSDNYENRSHGVKKMSFDIAKKGIELLRDHSRDINTVNIGFYGGEPLLEKELLKKCVSYAKTILSEKEVTFSITTNGTLLDDDIIEYLMENNFSVLISLDGPKEIHDRKRKFANGKGSFDTIIKNVTQVKEKYPEFFNRISFNAVISPENELQCINDFFNAEDIITSEYINYSMLSTNYLKNTISYDEQFIAASVYERFKLYLWLLNKISKNNVSKLFFQEVGNLEHDWEYLLPIEQLSEFCHPSGPCLPGVRRPLITVDGCIYPCERVNEESEIMKIGDVFTGLNIEKARTILNVGQVTEEECKECWCLLKCTACAAVADDNHKLSKSKKLKNCNNIKFTALESMKNICFLKEQGYDIKNRTLGFSKVI